MYIGFHCDEGAKHTVQIALNDDSEYDGGKLCFVTPGTTGAPHLKLTVPKRRAGTITSHGARILHAVTKLHKGVRYGLFVVDRDIGLGDHGDHCVDAETVVRVWKTRETKGIRSLKEREIPLRCRNDARPEVPILSF